MAMMDKCTLACLLAITVFAGPAPAQDPAVFLSNPGFEDDKKGNGLPDAWRCKTAAREPERAVNMDADVKHEGQYSLRIRHQKESSYSKISKGGFKPKPDTDYTATCWVKVAKDDPLQAGIEKSGGAKLLIIGKVGKKQKSLGHSISVFTTFGEWQRLIARFNSGAAKTISIMFYLHKVKGTAWFDDFELVEGKEPVQPTGPPSVFPAVDFLPGTVAMQKKFYLIQGEPANLVFFFIGDKSTTAGLELELNVPKGITLTKDFMAEGVPSGTPAAHERKKYLQYVLSVPSNRVRNKFVTKYGHILALEANGPGRVGDVIRWQLRRGERKDEPHQIAVTVLPPLPPLKAVPRQFEIMSYYSYPLRFCPPGEENDRLFDRMFQLLVKSGLKGGLLPATSSERAARVVGQESWRNGILAGFGPARYFDMKDLKKDRAQTVDARGKKYPGMRPCPTYSLERNIMKVVADRAFEQRYGRRGGVQLIKENDWFVIDYEPGRETWRDCYCQRCMKAFSEHSGIPAEQLDPPEIADRWSREWLEFRDQRKARLISQFSRAVKDISPKLRFGLCDGPKQDSSRSVTDPYIDFHSPMLYSFHPRKFFDVVEKEKKRVRKPFLPLIETKMGGYTHWTSPEELKLKIFSAATAGAEGIMLWPGMPSMGALEMVKIRECSDALVKLEDYFLHGQRKDAYFTVQPAMGKGFMYWGHRAHELGRHRLLTLFNFHSRKPAVFNVTADAAAAGDYSVIDHLTNTVFLTPAAGQRVWNKTDLQSGFSLEVPVGEAAFILLVPACAADAGWPARRLQKTVETGAGPASYTLEAPKVTAPPVIDGKLPEPMWKRAGLTTDFVRTEDPAEEQTSVRVAYDKKNLYIAFECLESRMNELVAKHTERDTAIWTDDCAEVFLRIRLEDYYHFIINPAGGLYDARGSLKVGTLEDAKWNSNVRLAASRTGRSWIVELSIPFADLNADSPSSGDAWGLNLGRTRYAGYAGKKYDKDKQSSSWFPMFGNFLPPKFGELKFSR